MLELIRMRSALHNVDSPVGVVDVTEGGFLHKFYLHRVDTTPKSKTNPKISNSAPDDNLHWIEKLSILSHFKR